MGDLNLTNKDRDEIFFSLILPAIVNGVTPSSTPIAELLGGQPAAGKSHFIKLLLKKDPNYAIINGDDLRGYHPQYNHFLRHNEVDAADLTQPDINYWIEKAIKELSKEKYPMIVEGTMKNPAVPLRTASLLGDSGYKVDMNVILINPKVSRVDLVKRYIYQKLEIGYARFTKSEAHDETAKKIYSNIMTIAGRSEIKTLRLFRREISEYSLIYEKEVNQHKEQDIEHKNSKLTSLLNIEMDKPMSTRELLYVKESWAKLENLRNINLEMQRYISAMRDDSLKKEGAINAEFIRS